MHSEESREGQDCPGLANRKQYRDVVSGLITGTVEPAGGVVLPAWLDTLGLDEESDYALLELPDDDERERGVHGATCPECGAPIWADDDGRAEYRLRLRRLVFATSRRNVVPCLRILRARAWRHCVGFSNDELCPKCTWQYVVDVHDANTLPPKVANAA